MLRASRRTTRFPSNRSATGLASTAALFLWILAGAPSPAAAASFVSGPVSGAWDDSVSPVNVIGDVTIPVGQQLVIEPDVIVKFVAGTSMHVRGTLVTIGLPLDPVTMTSALDPGAAQPGDWGSIYVYDGAVIDLDHTYIRYGGKDGTANISTPGGAAQKVSWIGGSCGRSLNDGVRVNANEITIDDVSFVENGADGLEIQSPNQPALGNISCQNNGAYAIRVTANPMSFPNTLTGGGNGIDGVFVTGTLGGVAPNQKWTWAAGEGVPPLPYVIGNLTCSGADTLEIGRNNAVYFAGTSSSILVSGAGAHLRTLGDAGGRVFFTSLKDDGPRGDVNGDGNATTPAPGDWSSIFVNVDATADLQYTDLRYGAGGGNAANLSTSNGRAGAITWVGGESNFSANDGVNVVCASADFQLFGASDNLGDGLEVNSTAPPVFGTSFAFYRNGGYAARVTANPGDFPGGWAGIQNHFQGIYVSGTLGGSASDRTWIWGPGFPYVVGGTLGLSSADTLHIPQGVVKFADASANLRLNHSAAKLRTGTTGDVWFTSLRDDAVGGDTNGDGAASSPAPGDWASVILDNDARAELTNTSFAYGGVSGSANLINYFGSLLQLTWSGGGTYHSAGDGLRLIGASVTLSNLFASYNAADGLDLQTTTPLALNQIEANGNGAYGIRVQQNPGSFPGNLTGSGNGVNGISVAGTVGGGEPAGRWTWGANPSFPYVVNNSLVCTAADTLEIAAGAIVKTTVGGTLRFNSGGVLRTLGTSSNPVWMTSLHDDAQGGDTNGNGAATSPAPGNWYGVIVETGGIAQLEETWIAYGGADGAANLTTIFGVGSLVWDGGGSMYSGNSGISGSFSTFDLERVRIAQNVGRGILVVPPAGARAVSCDIFANEAAGQRHGFFNNSTTMVDATNCWWGDASGPFDPSPGPPSINASGLGDRVTDYVNYGGWALVPNTSPPLGTGIESWESVTDAALTFSVRAPAPNPFRDVSRLEFSLPAEARVTAKVFDVTGRLVRTLTDSALPRGTHVLQWDGADASHNRAAPGVYFCRFVAELPGEMRTETRRVVLVR